ncbi:MAG: PAS domain S-box protein [Proteobacteria bacterium]|nr:PAS domain S-box protein [Pseudomonadota bacterium]
MLDKQVQDSMPADADHFRILVDAITDYAIYMLDPAGHVSSWNAGAQRFKGYAAREVIGRHFSVFYTDEDRAAGLPAEALRLAREEGRFEREGWRVRKDGSRFWAHVIIDPIRNDAGQIIGFAKITRDVTERMQAQHDLDLARQALFQSQKLDAIGQLTGGVAHDFNNLLMAVLGSLELLRKRLPADPKAHVLLENAFQGAQRGAALTQRMLAFARKQELKVEPVDIAELTGEMSGLIERSIGPSIELRVAVPEGLPPVMTDANQLETALLNLAVNARDAMPDGGTITIEALDIEIGGAAEIGLPAGGYVRLSVTDEGVGMDETTLHRAMEPFFTTKGVGKGTGLGLPMVHGVIEQSGGRMVVSSRPGEGTRVELWLPQASAARRPSATAATPREDNRVGRALTVLAVDDDELVLTNTAAMLEDLGHRVVTAASADQALTLLARTKPDLVITDFAMPQVTGLQLAQEIAARRPGLPVVLATGFAELPPGTADDLPRLAKPYSQPELAQVLQAICGAAPSPQP